MTDARTCADCTHFRNDANHLEQSFPGLTAMSSGRGTVRAADGLCDRHGLYLASFAYCDDLALRAAVPTRAAAGGPR